VVQGRGAGIGRGQAGRSGGEGRTALSPARMTLTDGDLSMQLGLDDIDRHRSTKLSSEPMI
jgi:hypothetical protein